MNRKPKPAQNAVNVASLESWRQTLLTRRQLLLASAGGVSLLFPLAAVSDKPVSSGNPWPVIDAVQQHLFPAEANAPGAKQINALGYLQFVVTDATLDETDRQFIIRGAGWLQDISQQMLQRPFVALNAEQREQVLQKIAASEAGENWLSTLLLYIVEALLTDPVYGGNVDQLGWKWLQHTPGFPRPPADKTFPHLLS